MKRIGFIAWLLAALLLAACGQQLPATPPPPVPPTETNPPDPPTPRPTPEPAPPADAPAPALDEPNPDLDFAQVEFVRASRAAGAAGAWRFDVTVRHNDQGWDHYADVWEVLAFDVEQGQPGEVLGTRVLTHPHDDEQPFTRSQSGILIPEGTRYVVVRARCNVHGDGGRAVLVDLAAEMGDGFEIARP